MNRTRTLHAATTTAVDGPLVVAHDSALSIQAAATGSEAATCDLLTDSLESYLALISYICC